MTEEQGPATRTASAAVGVVREVWAFGPAVLDQGVWSLAGFASAALVARLLGVEALGMFTVGTSIMFAVGALVTSLILDPAAVIGPRDHEDRLRSYGGLVVLASAAFGAVAAVMGVVILALSPGEWSAVASASLICTLPLLVAWASRRLQYLTTDANWALLGSTVYLMVVVGALLVASHINVLNPATAIAALGIGSIAQVAVILPIWRPRFRPATPRSELLHTAREHWRFGGWYLAAESAAWILNYGLAAISAVVIDLTATGGLRASQVLLRPYGIVFVGIGLAALPRLTRVRRDQGHGQMKASLRRIAWLLTGVSIFVFVAFLLAGGTIMNLVFGQEFAVYGWLVATLAGSMVLHGWVTAYSMGLQAANRPRDVFIGQAASAATSLVVGITLGLVWGLIGFAVAMVLADVARSIVVWRLWRRVDQDERK